MVAASYKQENHVTRYPVILYRSAVIRCSPEANNGILRRTSPIFRPVTFLVAFGVVFAATRTGWCVTAQLLYEQLRHMDIHHFVILVAIRLMVAY